MLISSIWSIHWTLPGATTQVRSGPGSDGNKGVLHILQSSNITGASPSDYLVSYPGYMLIWSYLSADIESVYLTASADRAEVTVIPIIEMVSKGSEKGTRKIGNQKKNQDHSSIR